MSALCVMPVACIPRFQYVEFLYFISLGKCVGLPYHQGGEWLECGYLECAMP